MDRDACDACYVAENSDGSLDVRLCSFHAAIDDLYDVCAEYLGRYDRGLGMTVSLYQKMKAAIAKADRMG